MDCAPSVYTHLRLGEINLAYREDTTPLGSFLVTYGSCPSIHPSRVVCRNIEVKFHALSAAPDLGYWRN